MIIFEFVPIILQLGHIIRLCSDLECASLSGQNFNCFIIVVFSSTFIIGEQMILNSYVKNNVVLISVVVRYPALESFRCSNTGCCIFCPSCSTDQSEIILIIIILLVPCIFEASRIICMGSYLKCSLIPHLGNSLFCAAFRIDPEIIVYCHIKHCSLGSSAFRHYTFECSAFVFCIIRCRSRSADLCAVSVPLIAH